MDEVHYQVREVLADGRASLTDINERGESILHVRIKIYHVHTLLTENKMACSIAEDLELTWTDVFEAYKRFLEFLASYTPDTMINETNTNGE